MIRYIHIILVLCAITAPGQAQSRSDSDDFSYALKLYNQEFYDLAAQQFVKYYNEYPSSQKIDEAKFYAGMSLFRLQEFNQARIEFQSLALEFPKSQKAGESWYKTGQSYEFLENPMEAVKAYESIKILYPDNSFAPRGLYKAASILIDRGEYERAARNINSILDRYPESAEYYPAMTKAAITQYQRGNVEQARLYLSKVKGAQPDASTLAETYLVSARIYRDLGQATEALNDLAVLIREYQKSEYFIPAVRAYAELQIRLGDYDSAQQYLNKALSSGLDDDRKPEIHALLADVYFLNENYALAEKEYEKLNPASCDSAHLIVRLKQALAKYRQGLLKQALTSLEEILEECPEKSTVLHEEIFDVYLSWLEESSEFEQAAAVVNRTLLDVTSLQTRIRLTSRLIYYYYQLERWREIIREAQSLVRVQDTFEQKDDLVFYLARAYEMIGDYDNSAYYYRQIVEEFASSAHYQEAGSRLEYLNDYRVINISRALTSMAKLHSRSLQGENREELQFELGKLFFSELKDYEQAEKVLNEAKSSSAGRMGDIHLYTGKTYLKLAYKKQTPAQEEAAYLAKAKSEFTKAVENIATCSSPDEASWQMVKTSVLIDTIPLQKEKTYIEKLINNYPQSSFLEKWYAELAFSLAFDTLFTEESMRYFRLLEQNFSESSRYPTYLYGYAKLLQHRQPEQALERFKRIASEYPLSGEAAHAVYEVARHYENAGLFKETNQLYERLTGYYYYSDLADKARESLRRIKLLAGLYEEAMHMISASLNPVFLSDPVLASEFIELDEFTDVFFLAEAYRNLGNFARAREYYGLYLQTHDAGIMVDKARFALGAYYYSEDQLNVALGHFEKIGKETASLYIQAKKRMGQILFRIGDYSKAALSYQEILDLTNDEQERSEAFAQLIICRIREGNLNQGENLIKDFRNRYKNTDDHLAHFTIELGEYQRAKKQYSKAVNYFRTVKSKYKKSSYVDDADYLLALTNIALNKHEEALQILSNFPSEYPSSDRLPAVYNTLGTIYFRSEKYDAAIATFKRALEIAGDAELERQVMSNLIKAYAMTGFWDAAQGLSRQYVQKYPFADDIIDKKITIAQAFINLNQFQNGVEYLKKIKIEADSEREPEIQFYIGEALLKAGQYESAIAEFVKIPLLSKKTKLQWEASALYYAGQAYEKLGRIKDAIRMYNEIVNRPGIDLILKKDAAKRIKQIEG